MNKPLPCIRCGVQPESATAPKDTTNQPYKATVFTSYGQYGSTVIDSMGEYFIEINVCDDCLRDRHTDVLRGSITRKTEHHYEPWNPNER